MDCPSCGHENRDAAKFCLGCGERFSSACASCHADLPAGARFCDECGAAVEQTDAPAVRQPDPRSYTPRHLADKILQSKSALEGERKQVTVLFVDIKGSVELSGSLDPEEWHGIMDGFFRVLAEGIHRFEGNINQYTGDGIMALFGAPIAHEDHAQRACYAALHLSEELRAYARQLRRDRGLSFSVRTGMNSGDVVVGKIGDDLRMDYTAQGLTVGLAARMQELAEPGKVYMTASTAALVSGYFDLEDLGMFDLRGAAEPAPVYELQGVGQAQTRLDVSRLRGFSKFVGRAAEMQSLESALERAATGQGQVIGIVGEAGVGKSRLCAEFLDRCRSRGITTYEGHGLPHGKAVPFLPILQVFRAFFGIREQDGASNAREKVAGRLLLLDESFRASLPLVFDFLGIADPEQPALRIDAESRQRQLAALIRGVMEARGDRETSVTLLEDLHWFDVGSEAFLSELVDAAPASHRLLLLSFRPEYRADWMQKSFYQQLSVAPLGPEAVHQLLQYLLGGDPSLRGVGEIIRERTGGNPFFVEEVVHTLAESGVLEGTRGAYRLVRPIQEASVPGTVQAVIGARIDRLPETEKQVLQAAAVIGRRFTEPILQRVADSSDLPAALSALESTEFILQESLYPEATYAFKHVLTWEVAYGSQLAERKARVHAAVAQTIEELDSERLDERAALLAYHWEGANKPLEAARWHRRAAVRAGAAHPIESMRHWRRIIELLAEVPSTDETAELGVMARALVIRDAGRVGAPEGEIDSVYAETRALAEHGVSARSRVILENSYGFVKGLCGRLAEGRRAVVEATRLAEELGDPELIAGTGYTRMAIMLVAGEFRELNVLTQKMMDLSESDPMLGMETMGAGLHRISRAWRGWSLVELGDSGAGEFVRRAVESLTDDRDALGTLVTHRASVHWSWVVGDGSTALASARKVIQLAEVLGTPGARAWAMMDIGTAHLIEGRWDDAIDALERGCSITRDSNSYRFNEAWSLARLARAYLARGDHVKARETAELAIRLSREQEMITSECEGQVALARTRVSEDAALDEPAIESSLIRAAALIETRGSRRLIPEIHEVRAAVAKRKGDTAGRSEQLLEAQRLYAEMGAPRHAERVAEEIES